MSINGCINPLNFEKFNIIINSRDQNGNEKNWNPNLNVQF